MKEDLIKLVHKGGSISVPYLQARQILSRKDALGRYKVESEVYTWDSKKNDFKRRTSKGENKISDK